MRKALIAMAISLAVAAPTAFAAGKPISTTPVVYVDATGNVAARLFGAGSGLLTLPGGAAVVVAVASVADANGSPVAGAATWAGGDAVLFTSANCTTGAFVYVYSLNPGTRASAQVATAGGVVLYIGAAAPGTSNPVFNSFLTSQGCATQSIAAGSVGSVWPVASALNLSVAYPPPLSVQ